MKHVVSDSKSLLIGDDAADLLVRYAVLLGQVRSADSIDINAVESTGNSTTVTFLLNAGSSLTVETANSPLTAPENVKAEQYMISRITDIERSRNPSIDDILGDDDPERF